MTVCTPTLLESIFSRAAGRSVKAGEVVEVPVDLVMAHDATCALLIQDFERLGCRVWNPDRLMITCDHFAPPARTDWADLQKSVLKFVERHRIPDLRMYEGICHQLLLEDHRVAPGTILVGADSHTTLAGAVGSFATGLGATDILAVLATGRTWFRTPETIRVNFTGLRQPWVMGRDLALYLLGHFGEDGASYRALELRDRTDDGLLMDSRAAISCMAPEMGAKAALFVPDYITAAFLYSRKVKVDAPATLTSSDQAQFSATLDINVSTIDSLIAAPHSPANIMPVRDVGGARVDQVYIGSCAGGRLEDLHIAARIMAGKKVARGVKAVIVPSSARVAQQAMAQGYIQTLLEAGFCISNPSCGACGGIDKGVLASGDVAVTTSTRNFQGRLGPRDSAVYLASTATCAATALTGRITPPEYIWDIETQAHVDHTHTQASPDHVQKETTSQGSAAAEAV